MDTAHSHSKIKNFGECWQWIREGESTKIIDLGFKKIVSPKILIKFVLKNIKNIYIHKYKINTLEWPSVVLGIKALRGLAAPASPASSPKSLSCSALTTLTFSLFPQHHTPSSLIRGVWPPYLPLLTPSLSSLKCYFPRDLSPFHQAG